MAEEEWESSWQAHFPLLRETIVAAVDDDVVVVDSAVTTATAVHDILRLHGGLLEIERAGTLKLLATDGIARFARVGGQFLGEALTVQDIQLVDL